MITNRLNLPEPLVAAVANDPYDNGGTLSVTTLLKPAQAVALGIKHGADTTEDAADRIWSLMGQIGHSIIERAAPGLDPARYIAERRFYMDIEQHRMKDFVRDFKGDPETRLRVSGAADLIDVVDEEVLDFKFTSGWAVMSARENGGKSEWQHQLSALAMLAREGGWIDHGIYGGATPPQPISIKRGKIVAIVRDWTKSQALKNPNFPQQPVEVLDMNILSDAETREWMDMRIEALKFALDGNDAPCTDEERWAKKGGWAVYKGSNKTAARVMPSELELSAWIGMNRSKVGDNYRIEERPTVYNRCSSYCSAASFCRQHQQSLGPQEALAGEPTEPADM